MLGRGGIVRKPPELLKLAGFTPAVNELSPPPGACARSHLTARRFPLSWPLTVVSTHPAPAGGLKREGGEKPPRTRRRDGPIAKCDPPRPPCHCRACNGPRWEGGPGSSPKPEDLPQSLGNALANRAWPRGTGPFPPALPPARAP